MSDNYDLRPSTTEFIVYYKDEPVGIVFDTQWGQEGRDGAEWTYNEGWGCTEYQESRWRSGKSVYDLVLGEFGERRNKEFGDGVLPPYTYSKDMDTAIGEFFEVWFETERRKDSYKTYEVHYRTVQEGSNEVFACSEEDAERQFRSSRDRWLNGAITVTSINEVSTDKAE